MQIEEIVIIKKNYSEKRKTLNKERKINEENKILIKNQLDLRFNIITLLLLTYSCLFISPKFKLKINVAGLGYFNILIHYSRIHFHFKC